MGKLFKVERNEITIWDQAACAVLNGLHAAMYTGSVEDAAQIAANAANALVEERRRHIIDEKYEDDDV